MKNPTVCNAITKWVEPFCARNRLIYTLCIGLALTVLAVYWPVYSHDFVTLDDTAYVTGNSRIKAGLTVDNILWAFTSIREAYWQPLTLISHMLDCSLFGMTAGGHLGVNLLFHIANGILLFVILSRSTGSLWPSAFVAALFALHPLNVESVAWVASRKTVLSTFFGFGALLAYVNYTARPQRGMYLVSILLFSFALLSKPTAIVIPCIIVLLDFWPLGRFAGAFAERENRRSRFSRNDVTKTVIPILLEKAPFFLLAFVLVLVSMLSASHKDILLSTEFIPLGLRVENAVLAYLKYPVKMLGPVGLAVFYPFPDTISFWKVICALFALVGITGFVILFARRIPYLAVGWFWYVGALIPTVGIVQAGTWPAWADRWAYVPLIGLFIAIAWGAKKLFDKRRLYRFLALSLALVCLSVLAALTRVQVSHWKNSETLFVHTLAHTRGNFLAHGNLGVAYAQRGKPREAVDQFRQALQKVPELHPYRNNLTAALAKGLNDLATDRIVQGRLGEAIALYRESLRQNPNSIKTLDNYGLALLRDGKPEQALALFEKAVQIEPAFARASRNRSLCRRLLNRIETAAAVFKRELQIKGESPEPLEWLQSVSRSKQNMNTAVADLVRALSMQPGFRPDTFEIDNLSKVQAVSLVYEETEPVFLRLYRNGKGPALTAYHLACINARKSDPKAAISWLSMAVRNGFTDWNMLRNDPDLWILQKSTEYEKIVPKT